MCSLFEVFNSRMISSGVSAINAETKCILVFHYKDSNLNYIKEQKTTAIRLNMSTMENDDRRRIRRGSRASAEVGSVLVSRGKEAVSWTEVLSGLLGLGQPGAFKSELTGGVITLQGAPFTGWHPPFANRLTDKQPQSFPHDSLFPQVARALGLLSDLHFRSPRV